MASKTNRAAANKAIYSAMNRTDNKLAERFFSKNISDPKKNAKALKNKVEDKRMTQTRQKH
jgi:hypothetical protein